ncbi:hypothetical protein LCGC14_1239330 [marine sediment metagenome]|uniref:Uncharacterized protein n=1 Tax=marine sediment metagenome TaxID=412755 RepID=A0A0F9PAG9_9ZZZZ
MSDSKKPKLSEIKARYKTTRSRQRGFLTEDYFYLLDLISRMGKRLKIASPYIASGCQCQGCQETRALLSEIKE